MGGTLDSVNLVAIIQSPLQALNLVEYSHRFGRRVDFVLVADIPAVGPNSRTRIEAVLSLVSPRQVIYHDTRLWPQRRPSRRTLVSAEATLRAHLSDSSYEFVVGEFRSTFAWAVLHSLKDLTRNIVVLDDGAATLRIGRRRSVPQSRQQWRQKFIIFLLFACGIRAPVPRGGLTFFTAYALEDRVAVDDTVVRNDYRTLSAELRALPPDDCSVYVIGGPYREAGVVDKGDVELALALTRFARESTGKEVVYMAHHREGPDKLDALREEVTVVTQNVPFEIYPRVLGKRPRTVVGYYSSLFVTLAELFGDSVEIIALEIPRGAVKNSVLPGIDSVYSYYRTELGSVVRVVEQPTGVLE